MTLRARAPGKVNLCLLLGPTRADGLHELLSLVQSVSLADELTLEEAPGLAADEVVCPAVPGPNLAHAALRLLRERTGYDGPPWRLTIEKRVPVAAGMGGGSGDAAAALRLAAEAAGRPDDPLLPELAFSLGADVPAQLRPGLHLVSGAGEEVEAVAAHSPFALVVLPSARRLATPDVFREADRLGLGRTRGELSARRDALRRSPLPPELLVNDLEPAARSLLPEIDDALAAIRDAGAEHAMVSGSGPTVFGLFPSEAAARRGASALGPPAVAATPVFAC